MSGKNSKTTIALGLLTTIFLFSTIQLAFSPQSIGFFTAINWLFNDSIGFSTHQLAFSPQSIGFFNHYFPFFTAPLGF